MTNIFTDVRRLVLAAIGDLAAQGALPPGLDLSRVAVEPPRDPAHGDLATNAAMVLAGAVRQNPMALAERIGAALTAASWYRRLSRRGVDRRCGAAGLSEHPAAARSVARATARDSRRRRRLWRFGDGRRRAGQCRIRLGQSDRADACRPRPRRRRRRRARGIAGEGRVSRSSANTTSTTPAPRSTCSPARSICAIARRSASRSGRSRTGSIPASI